MPIEEFFNYTNALLEDNPPAAYDEKIVKRIAQINIGKGLKFSLSDFDEATKLALDSLTGNIYKELDSGGITVNAEEQKRRSVILGNFGKDYYYRLFIAYYGLGALPPEEAIYIDLKSDAANKRLNGNFNYVIHFDKGKLPPSKAFWSLTVYDKERYLSKNDINRYAIGDRDSLKYNADGSLDIYIGHQNPGAAKVSNWLPAPADQFYLAFRIYVPEDDYVKNRSVWKNPQLQKIAE